MLACGADAEFPTGAEPGAARGGGGADPSGAVGPLRERLLGGGRSAPPHSAPSRPALPVLPAPRVAPPRPADGPATAPRGSLPPMNGEGWAGGAGPGLHYVTVFVSAASLWIGGGGKRRFRLGQSERRVSRRVFLLGPSGFRLFSRIFYRSQSKRGASSHAFQPNQSEHGSSSSFSAQPIRALALVSLFSAPPIRALALPALLSPPDHSTELLPAPLA